MSKGQFLKYKLYTNTATLNTRTIRLKSKQIELAHKCRDYSISIIGIVDHKIVHDSKDQDEILYKVIEDRILITSSAWRLDNNAASGGVGLMISKSAANSLAEVKKNGTNV